MSMGRIIKFATGAALIAGGPVHAGIIRRTVAGWQMEERRETVGAPV